MLFNTTIEEQIADQLLNKIAFIFLGHSLLLTCWPSEDSCFWKKWFDRKGTCQVETPGLQGLVIHWLATTNLIREGFLGHSSTLKKDTPGTVGAHLNQKGLI